MEQSPNPLPVQTEQRFQPRLPDQNSVSVSTGKKHSGLGIASFVTSIVAAVFIFFLIVAAGALGMSSPDGLNRDVATLGGLLVIAFTGIAFIALGLGIGALFQRERKKIFAILGTVFSGLVILGVSLIILLGMAIGSSLPEQI